MDALLNALRARPSAPARAPVRVATTMAEEPVKKSVQGPMIEFNRGHNGRVESIDVRSNGKVRTLIINRDGDNNILNATLVKERK